ncbi:glycosyltransferase [Prosthecomicrobium pneumaticum]|uniref:Glycosyltransferase involved in cell wall biosynthesis n=1 Tax=Prosthecomicrobium pneumaticum TaxID=81895 RepID=A0A7W9FQ22_9HYPH|nr:glycosyltransferase involved in cell wall biosynthesis [Prosthecomicrobium pneumaticum]
MGKDERLRIVHCFRNPVGGLFRHVRDLAVAQAEAGHAVGLVYDSSTGGAYEDRLVAAIRNHLALGIARVPMRRQIAPSDIATAIRLFRRIRALGPDVIHAHGAKGGAYGRVIGTLLRVSGSRVARIYTPHGGSLHYDAGTASGWAYHRLERLLEAMTDGLIFVSRYEADAYRDKVGAPRPPVTIVPNGLAAAEFEPVATAPDAADFLFIGMMRDLKGPDLFIEAMRLLHANGLAPTAHMVGDGDGLPRYRAIVEAAGLGEAIRFHPAMPARAAFAMARAVVVPSRAEAMPYIVLEALAAGRPTVATAVGGIPEIFAGRADALVPPGDAMALAAAMAELLDAPAASRDTAEALRESVRTRFSIAAMTAAVAGAYRGAR